MPSRLLVLSHTRLLLSSVRHPELPANGIEPSVNPQMSGASSSKPPATTLVKYIYGLASLDSMISSVPLVPADGVMLDRYELSTDVTVMR